MPKENYQRCRSGSRTYAAVSTDPRASARHEKKCDNGKFTQMVDDDTDSRRCGGGVFARRRLSGRPCRRRYPRRPWHGKPGTRCRRMRSATAAAAREAPASADWRLRYFALTKKEVAKMTTVENPGTAEGPRGRGGGRRSRVLDYVTADLTGTSANRRRKNLERTIHVVVLGSALQWSKIGTPNRGSRSAGFLRR